MITAVVGVNWGDEGKGRMVDLLSESSHIVARCQGGNNAGHTVVNERGKFVLNLLPSGILREDTKNVMGPGMVVDLEHLAGETGRLREQGVAITPFNLLISDRATICLPFHRLLDGLEEDRLAAHKQGSTRRGIAPVYADKFMRKALRMSDLCHPDSLYEKVRALVEWKNLTLRGYGPENEATADSVYHWLRRYGEPLVPYIRNVTSYLNDAIDGGANVLLELQLGALRDIDFGIYPYTSSSTTLAAGAPIGAGIPNRRAEQVVGVMKAYSTCVGGGPFVCEFSGAEAEALREAGGEYGAATGRPRRVGGFDIPASRYGALLQGVTDLALTKLDVLSGMEKLPVCVAYEVDGVRTQDFPTGDELERAKPVYEYLPGFSGDISGCRRFIDLPEAARRYVRLLEEAVRRPIRWVSVGAGREQYLELD